MAYNTFFGPHRSENWQDNNFQGYDWFRNPDAFFNPGHGFPDEGHKRSAPAESPFVEYNPDTGGWAQGPHRLPRDFKPKKYWARPVDGKRRGALGRLADGLTGEGADVFVVLNGDRRTLMRDMPHRAQWSGWKGPRWDPNHNRFQWDKDATAGEGVHLEMPWARSGGHRYNFFTREYETGRERRRNHAQGRLWSDAHWAEGAGRNDPMPLSFRTSPWTYSSRVSPWAGLWAGGRPQMGNDN